MDPGTFRMKVFIYSILFIAITSSILSCSLKWTDAVQKGELTSVNFNESIPFDTKIGLIIIPVKIRGEYYRFLFDSGAPTSISTKIQDKLKFKTISKGGAVDSENNRIKIKYVEIDTIEIQGIPFLDQTAFVGDFEANPTIKCFEIDGIIGSNLMRYCNWTIDYDRKIITFFNEAYIPNEEVSVPFYTNDQFDILVNLNIGNVEIKRLKIDYGSNGSISFPASVFLSLKKEGHIKKSFVEKGVSQSGMFGEVNDVNSELAYLDTLKLGDYIIEDISVISRNTSLIGGQLLSELILTIDWDNKMLHIRKNPAITRDNMTFGMRIGFDVINQRLYVQSVIDSSSAFESGIRPSMLIQKIDSLNFSTSSTFCDYVDYMNNKPSYMPIELRDFDGQLRLITVRKERLILD